MEYVNGGDLKNLKRAISYSCLLHERDIWFIFGQIAGAPNVLLTKNGIVKLADFGLSRLNLAVHAQTFCGSPYYMSQMAAAKSPFYGQKYNFQSLMQKIQNAEYPPIPDDRYTPHLEALIVSCMHPDMNERPNAFTVYEVAR